MPQPALSLLGRLTPVPSALEQASPKQVTVEPREPQPERKTVAPPLHGHLILVPSVPEQTSHKQVTVELREPQQERKRVPPDHAEPQQKPTHLRQLHTREPFVV